jgi:CubicO group peptidase (beta-lactamase class C family)
LVVVLEELRGVAIVARSGSPVLEAAGGLADESGAACTTTTRFQIASVSKQFTAAAVLLLAERGAIGLQDPIEQWLVGCPRAWAHITVHHLLTHTSGLGHWPDFPDLDLYRPMDPDEQLAIFQRAPLRSRPGTSWSYSSPGYVLLGWIVQRASGQPYATFLEERIFEPLGLRSTTVGDPPGGDGMARGYRDGRPVPSFELATVGLGAGDIWSTAGDLARYDAALGSGAFLTSATRRAMCTPHGRLGDQEGAGGWGDGWWRYDGYGYGWFVGTVAGRPVYFHPGDNPGYQAFNAWLPGEDLSVVVLTNDEMVDIKRLLKRLLGSEP